MNRAREDRAGIEPRAKYLRHESGVMRAVHVGQVVAANDSGEGVESAAERPAWIRLRSPEKTAVRAESSAIFDVAVALRGLSNADVGATVNEGKEVVRRMRAGALPVTMDHLLRLARRRPELFEDIMEQLRGSKK